MDERLRRVFSDVFGIDGAALNNDASPNTIEGWDSVAHLHLVLALEGEFEIQFEVEVIPELISFGAVREQLGGALDEIAE